MLLKTYSGWERENKKVRQTGKMSKGHGSDGRSDRHRSWGREALCTRWALVAKWLCSAAASLEDACQQTGCCILIVCLSEVENVLFSNVKHHHCSQTGKIMFDCRESVWGR